MFKPLPILASALAAGLVLLPAAALAHTGHTAVSGLAAGLAHPLAGWDHLLAMLAVGLWAGQLGGRAAWSLPLAFVVLMLAGGALGMAAWGLPLAETGILASLVVLGLLVAGALRLPLQLGLPLVGLFAVFHGVAHGGEIPALASGAAYSTGFALSTAALHFAGIGTAVALKRVRGGLALRAAGAGVALGGVALLFA